LIVTQYAPPTLVPTTDTGVTLSDKMNGALAALYSTHAGAAAPPSPVDGQIWMDTSGIGGSPKIVLMKSRQEGAWVTMGTLNLTANSYVVTGGLSTAGGTLTGTLLFVDGTTGAPGIAFAADTNTGIWRVASDQIGMSTGGVERFRITTTQIIGNIPIRGPAGTVAAPALQVTGSSGAGMYSGGTNSINMAANGILVANWAGGLITHYVSTTITGAGATLNIVATSGQGGIEIGGVTGSYIDLKAPASDDFDLRIATSGTGGNIQTVGDLSLLPGSQILRMGPALYIQEQSGVLSTIVSFRDNTGASERANITYDAVNNNFGFTNVLTGKWLSLRGDGRAQFNGELLATGLRGGPSDAGTLLTWGGVHWLNFNWNDPTGTFYIRLDESVQFAVPYSSNLKVIQNSGVALQTTQIDGTMGYINYDTISDMRLKTNIELATVDVLKGLRSLPIVKFRWNEKAQAMDPTKQEQPNVPVGIIAQELQKIAPRLVTSARLSTAEGEIDYLIPDYKGMVPYLIRSIQQQSDIIDALTARIAALEAKT
jgi:hypothetical protein